MFVLFCFIFFVLFFKMSMYNKNRCILLKLTCFLYDKKLTLTLLLFVSTHMLEFVFEFSVVEYSKICSPKFENTVLSNGPDNVTEAKFARSDSPHQASVA